MDRRLLFTLGSILVFFATLDLADLANERWPRVDEDGYYQSYKESGSWVNWCQSCIKLFASTDALWPVHIVIVK
jgi:hypothetical protein